MDSILSIKNLTKKFGDLCAVEDVSFDLPRGEIFSLIGPNGSGKTTLVKVVTGLLRPTTGSVKISGIDISVNPVEAKQNVGYIPDEPSVWNHLTGEEFLHLVGTLYGVAQATRITRLHKLLATYHLEGIEKGYFQHYSRGNKQKFTIIAALLHEPKLLIIDEPIVGLDPESIAITKIVLKDFVKAGGTILMVTHLLDIAEDISTRIGVLKLGELIDIGTLSELQHKAKLKENSTLENVYLELTKNK